MRVKREVIYAENGLKLFFYSESGVSAAEEARSFLALHFDHFNLGPRFFELQFADDTSLGIPFETAQGEARATEMAIVGKPVHGNKGWLLVTDGKFGDEGKPTRIGATRYSTTKRASPSIRTTSVSGYTASAKPSRTRGGRSSS